MAYSNRRENILCEDNALRLNDKEVNELVDIAKHRVKSLLGHGVVLAWADLGGEARREQGLASDLGQDGNTQSHPCELEPISEDVHVSSSEDEEDGGEVRNSRGTWVIPAQERAKERVVVSEGLTSGRRLGRSCAGIGQVGEFRGGLRRLVLDANSNGTFSTHVSAVFMRGCDKAVKLTVSHGLGDRVVLDGVDGS